MYPMVGANCVSLETTVEIRASVGERDCTLMGLWLERLNIKVVPEVVCG